LEGHVITHPRSRRPWRRLIATAAAALAASAGSLAVTASPALAFAGAARSFKVTTVGFDTRFLRHQDSLARTDVITASSSTAAKQDGTFTVRTGLAESSCYSFESVNYPGKYLRHSSFRLRIDAGDGTTTFQQDATFCAQSALNGGSGNVSLESYNYPGYRVAGQTPS
jgi:hypothetical protein